jgi:hypothetical protein
MVVASFALLIALGSGAYAAIPDSDDHEIHGCYSNRDGSLRVIDAQPGGACANKETPLIWNQQGQQGLQGQQGPAGPPGPPGTIDSFDALNGLPCNNNPVTSRTGQTVLTFGHDGSAKIGCAVEGPASTPDPWNNDFASAENITIGCGGSAARTGSINPAGTSDWFKVSYTPATCSSLKVTVQTPPGGIARFDLLDEHAVKLNNIGGGTEIGWSFPVAATPNPVWVRMWSPYVTTPWTLSVAVE